MSKNQQQYSGSCHCGAVQFEFQHEPIGAALQCNCSICIRKNAIMSLDYIAPEHFQLTQGEAALSLYHWGDNDVNHWFCKTCGIYPFHDSIYEPGKYRVNLCCVDGIDPRALEIKQYDGKHLL
jgi:hypothetical protein